MTAVLEPAVVAAIDDLELAARVIVDGIRTGGHRSPLQGHGAEFQQHRPYRAGDDLKYLDWKVFGRSDRLYTRQFRETTNMHLMLVVDTSASMAYPIEGPGLSKFRYAVLLAAALAYLASEQGHAVGLMSNTHGALTYLPARAGLVHRRQLLLALDGLRPAGRWEPEGMIDRAADLLGRRGLMLVLSDFYDDEAGTQRALRHARQRGHDVAMLQLLSRAETQLPTGGTLALQDLETGVQQPIDTALAASAYAAEVAAFCARCQTAAQHAGMDYVRFDTDAPLDRALREWLVRRQTGR